MRHFTWWNRIQLSDQKLTCCIRSVQAWKESAMHFRHFGIRNVTEVHTWRMTDGFVKCVKLSTRQSGAIHHTYSMRFTPSHVKWQNRVTAKFKFSNSNFHPRISKDGQHFSAVIPQPLHQFSSNFTHTYKNHATFISKTFNPSNQKLPQRYHPKNFQFIFSLTFTHEFYWKSSTNKK